MRAKSLSLDPLSEEQILALRMCELYIKLKGCCVEARVQPLYKKVQGKGLEFRPHVDIGDDWFTPHAVTAIAAPFYLPHPKLLQLERKMMLEAEGGDPAE